MLALNFYPCAGGATQCSTNNGNIMSQTIAFPAIGTAPGLNVTQSYTYDNLNRLIGASEGSGWSRAFGYDAYGNMWVSADSGVPEDPFTPTVSTNFDAYNRLIIQNSSYGLAGNQKTIGGFANSYDAEDRQVTAAIGSTTTNYVYDGEGRRVQKAMGGVTTTYVYNAEGELAVAAARHERFFLDSELGHGRDLVLLRHISSKAGPLGFRERRAGFILPGRATVQNQRQQKHRPAQRGGESQFRHRCYCCGGG